MISDDEDFMKFSKVIDKKFVFGKILLKESPANKWTFKKR